MEQLTYLEFLARLPQTDDPVELQRREKLYDQRESEYEQMQPGQVLYMIKNKVTKALIFKLAYTPEDAMKALGWPMLDCRHLPIAVGKEKQVMPDAIKSHLKEIQKERHALRNSGKQHPEPEAKYVEIDTLTSKPVTNYVVQAGNVGKIRLRDQLINLWPALKGFSQDQKIDAIAQLLKAKNPQIDVVKQSKWYYYKLKRELGE